MILKRITFTVTVIFVLTLGGCSTAQKQKDLEIQGLRNQISVLEAQIQSKEQEIADLREKLTVSPVAEKGRKVIPEVKSRPNVKQIQIALRNAGYNPGPVDGKMGRQTRDAIRAFQRANNLAVDGKVGKKTWCLLIKHLYKKAK